MRLDQSRPYHADESEPTHWHSPQCRAVLGLKWGLHRLTVGFPGSSRGREPACQYGDSLETDHGSPLASCTFPRTYVSNSILLLLLLSRFSRVRLCNPIDGSPPGSPIPGILQARPLEWVAISFSNERKCRVKVKSLSHVQLPATPWTAAHQAPPSLGFSRQDHWSGWPLPSLQFC